MKRVSYAERLAAFRGLEAPEPSHPRRRAGSSRRRRAARASSRAPSSSSSTLAALLAPRRPPSEVQSLLFRRPAWTVAKAKSWARAHGYKFGTVEVTDKYIHLPQLDPK